LSEHLHDRYLGCLVGLALGDALGAPIEGRPRGSFPPVVGISEEPRPGLPVGGWTDDTALALCLAASLIERVGFDPSDQMQRYVRWYREGYMSASGACYGIGRTVREAIKRFEKTGEPLGGSTDPLTAGNGSLMRLAPIPLYMLHDGARAKHLAAEMSKTTHGATEAVDACRYMTGLIVGALRGEPKERILSDLFSPVYNYWFFQRLALAPKIDAIARGNYKEKQADELPATAYVVDTLEAALWAFHRSTNFRDGALLAVNLGNDADTTGAVYGQLAGAFYGYGAIPAEWREKLVHRELIEGLATQLLKQTAQGIRHFTSLS
jgi:ADP-ribosylglycohydrolase